MYLCQHFNAPFPIDNASGWSLLYICSVSRQIDFCDLLVPWVFQTTERQGFAKILGLDSLYRWRLTSVGNPIVEIRRSYDRLISTMGFPILVRRQLYIESGPWYHCCMSQHVSHTAQMHLHISARGFLKILTTSLSAFQCNCTDIRRYLCFRWVIALFKKTCSFWKPHSICWHAYVPSYQNLRQASLWTQYRYWWVKKKTQGSGGHIIRIPLLLMK